MAQRRVTRQRQLVYSAVKDLHNHPSADEIFSYVRTREPHVSRATVYRNLGLLVEDGLIMDVKVPNGMRYDAHVVPHAHLLCTRCGLVVDAPAPYNVSLDHEVATASHYADVSHTALFFGICPACQQADESPSKKERLQSREKKGKDT